MSNSMIIIQLPEIFPNSQPSLRSGAAEDSFNVDAQGYGSFTGLAYTVPAHTRGKITAQIQTPSLTSNDVENLNNLIKGMVQSSAYEKIREYEEIHGSANLSFFGFFSGGGRASYTKTKEEMRGFGLSEENIRTIVSKMAELSQQMSRVQIDFEVENTGNDYAVSGSLMIYTIAGSISTGNSQIQYRMLADKGVAGSNALTAPAAGQIIPLS